MGFTLSGRFGPPGQILLRASASGLMDLGNVNFFRHSQLTIQILGSNLNKVTSPGHSGLSGLDFDMGFCLERVSDSRQVTYFVEIWKIFKYKGAPL